MICVEQRCDNCYWIGFCARGEPHYPDCAGWRQQATGVPVTINDLESERYHLRAPISVMVENYDVEVIARWPSVEAFGYGETEEDALSTLKQDIVSLYLDLRESPDQLGSLPQKWLRILTASITERR